MHGFYTVLALFSSGAAPELAHITSNVAQWSTQDSPPRQVHIHTVISICDHRIRAYRKGTPNLTIGVPKKGQYIQPIRNEFTGVCTN